MHMYLFVVLIAALSGFLHGYIVDITNKLIDQASFVDFIAPHPGPFVYYYYTCFYAGQGAGLAYCYIISDKVGRRTTLLYCSVFLAAIFSWASTTNSEVQTLLTRFFIGCISIILLVTSIVYLTEISIDASRALTITAIPLLIQTGKLASTVLFTVTKAQDENWRVCMGVVVLLSLGMLLGITSIPESPRWLLAYKSPGEGLSALKQLRNTPEVMVEFNTIFRAVVTDAKYESLWHTLVSEISLRYRLVIVAVISACYAVTNTFVTDYQTAFLSNIGASTHHIVTLHQILKLFGLVCTLAGGYILGNGRRSNIIASLMLLLTVLFVLSLLGALINTTNMLFYYFVQYVLFVCYVVALVVAMGVLYPVIFLLPAEIFPLRHRTRSIALSLLLTRVAVVLCSSGKTSLVVIVRICLLVVVICGAYLFVALPETAGVLFSDMDNLFSIEGAESCCGICPLPTVDGYIGWRIMSNSSASNPPSWLAYRSRPSFCSETQSFSSVEKKIIAGNKRRTSGGTVKRGLLSYQHSSPFNYGASSLRPTASSDSLDQGHKYSQQLRDSAFQYLESNEDSVQASEWFSRPIQSQR